MAEQELPGALESEATTPQPQDLEAPAPGPTEPSVEIPPAKPKKPKLSTQGRKPKTQSTKAEMNRERLTAKVITLLVAGGTNNSIAAELDISVEWVKRVRKELPEEFLHFFQTAKTNQISELVEQGLRAQLLAMIKIVEVTNDEVWLKAQRAPELATFFGVINDKTIRVLAAIERADERARVERSYIPEAGEVTPGGQEIRREPKVATQGA